MNFILVKKGFENLNIQMLLKPARRCRTETSCFPNYLHSVVCTAPGTERRAPSGLRRADQKSLSRNNLTIVKKITQRMKLISSRTSFLLDAPPWGNIRAFACVFACLRCAQSSQQQGASCPNLYLVQLSQRIPCPGMSKYVSPPGMISSHHEHASLPLVH